MLRSDDKLGRKLKKTDRGAGSKAGRFTDGLRPKYLTDQFGPKKLLIEQQKSYLMMCKQIQLT